MMGSTGEAQNRAELLVHVQPRARQTEVVGWHGEAIKVRISAPPVDGAANEELVRFLARQARVPKSAVRILSGVSSRRKRISVAGIDLSQLLVSLNVTAE